MKARRVVAIRAGQAAAQREREEEIEDETNLPPELYEEMKVAPVLPGVAGGKWTAAVRLRAMEFFFANKVRYDYLSAMRKERTREVIIYMAFVAIFTYVAMSARDTSSAHFFSSGMKNYFELTGMPATEVKNGNKNFYGIGVLDDLYSWLRSVFVPRLRPRGDKFADNSTVPLTFAGNNIIVGHVRVRQSRVITKDCKVPKSLDGRGAQCYPSFDTGVEMKTTPQAWIDKWIQVTGNNDTTQVPSWFTYKASEGSNYANSVSRVTYGTSGYEMILDMNNLADAQANIQLASDIGWLDMSNSRACFAEFSIYNPNVNMFMTATFLVQISPSSGLLLRTTYRVVNLYRFARVRSLIDLVIEAVMFAFVFYYGVAEVRNIMKEGRLYWTHGFNYLSIMNIVVFIIVGSLEVYTIVSSSNLFDETASADVVDDQRLRSLAFWTYQIYNWNAFNALLTWLRLTKYMDLLSAKTRQLSHTLSRSAGDVFIVLLIFIVIYFGYSLAFYLAFGQDMVDYAYVDSSMISLFLSLLGVFSFEDLRTSNRILGPILFVSYVLVMVFCIMNMFLTVIMKNYDQVALELEQSPDELPSHIRRVIRRKFKELFMKKKAPPVGAMRSRRNAVLPVNDAPNGDINKGDDEEIDPETQVLTDEELEEIYMVEEPRLKQLGINSAYEMKKIADLDMDGSVSVAEIMQFKAIAKDDEDNEEEETHLIMKVLERTNQIVQEQRALLSLLQQNTTPFGPSVAKISTISLGPQIPAGSSTVQSSLNGMFNSAAANRPAGTVYSQGTQGRMPGGNNTTLVTPQAPNYR